MREIPYVGGFSGHTVKLLSIAHGMTDPNNELTTEELKIYTLTIAAFLIAPGAHSFHEVYSVADLVGVPYESGRYENPLPLVFKSHEAYHALLKQFPDIIQPELIKHTLSSPYQFFASIEQRKTLNLKPCFSPRKSSHPSMGEEKPSLSNLFNYLSL